MLMTCSKDLDWRGESEKECFRLTEKGSNALPREESFEKQTSDLCHNAQAGPTQIGSLLRRMTQMEVTTLQ